MGSSKTPGSSNLPDLEARPALDQHGAKKAQRIFLKLESVVKIVNTHVAAPRSA